MRGVAASRHYFELATWNAVSQPERGRMCAILGPSDDQSRTGNRRVVIFRIRHLMGTELVDERRYIDAAAALLEQPGEELRRRRRTEGRAHALHDVQSAVVNSFLRICLDEASSERLGWVVTNPRHDQRRGPCRMAMIH